MVIGSVIRFKRGRVYIVYLKKAIYRLNEALPRF